MVAEVVRSAVGDPAAYSAAGQPDGEPFDGVVATRSAAVGFTMAFVQTIGNEARFKKIERGKFALASK